MITTVIIKLTKNGHPSAVRCSLFGIWSNIGLKHVMHVVVVISERLLKNFSNTCQERAGLPMLGQRHSLSGWRCLWVDNRSKGVLGRSGKSLVNVISSSMRRSVQTGKRLAIGRIWILGVGPTSFFSRGDVKCSQAKGRKKF